MEEYLEIKVNGGKLRSKGKCRKLRTKDNGGKLRSRGK
jgi:hypothetical protein